MQRWALQLSSRRYISLFLLCLFFAPCANTQEIMTLPQGRVGTAYFAKITTDGGMEPLKWALVTGDLPPGLHLSASGTIEGTPMASSAEAYSFQVGVSDSSQAARTVVQRFSILILPAPLRITGVAPQQSQLRIVSVSVPSGSADNAGRTEDPGHGPVAESQGQADPQQVPSKKKSGGDSTTPTKPTSDANPTAQTGQQPSSTADKTGISGGPMLRTIVGFEQAGVSAAQSQQDFFLDLYYDRPVAFKVDPDLGPALRSWGNLRVSSVPQQINTSVAEFAAGFAQQVGQLKVNQVAQSFEFLGGIEYRLWSSPRSPKDYASTDIQNDQETHNRISANLILGGGVITPLSPQQSVQVFDVPSNQPSFFVQYPQASGKQYVAFSVLGRNRFFRQAYGGFRLKTHFFGDTTRTRFPETFDLTYGFNESITAGTIAGGVMRLEGFVPIPYAKASWIYLFGTGLFKPGGRATTTAPFFLDQAPSGTLPTNAGAVVIPTPQANRDYYRVGIGIDFVDLIKNWSSNTKSGNSKTANKDSNASKASQQ